MKYFTKYIKKYWIPFCLAVAFLTVEAMCDLMQPTIMSKIVDIGVAKKDMSYVVDMGIKMLIVTGIGALAAASRNIIATIVSQNFGTEMRADLFKKVQNLSFENIDRFEGGTLLTRMTNDVTQVQNFINGLMRIFVKAPLLCVGSIIMAVRLNAHMSLIFLVVVPFVCLLIFLNMKIGYPYYVKIQKALDKVNSVMREYLTGVRVVKAFNRFSYESERFDKANEELTDISATTMRVMAVFSPVITLIVNIGIVAIIWIGGIGVNSGNIKVGQIIAFTNYMTQILFSLMMISHVFTILVRARASRERIGEIFAQENTMKFEDNEESLSGVKGKIELRNVCFSYRDALGEPVLKNINFACDAGQTIGIIGSTGSGKSSLVNLIPRFYDVTSGEIYIDDVNIKNMDIKALRDKISIVPQKIVLFSGTIMDNIKWGKEDASAGDIKEAAIVAQAHEFIEACPEKYDTLLGQGGVNLSGGQKQRISIARALIRKPEILILDDCTSAVDTNTESKIRKGLKSYSKDVTSIIIAQKITSVMEADKIIVIDNGEIVGMGKHEELRINCQVYRDILKSQMGKEVA